ncbi:acetolactate synthase large subunit [Halobacterium zhouii]|uniref:acetolactate synthase large subunit n=1 Tax=Halobacterium zhouii TaxID=2902624 RepID=UPI001E3ED936|nr:acetolactate synthase large subunit [Halobacterium zhouii]
MNTAECLVASLEAEGVERVFGLPGEETEDMLFALRDSDVEYVPVRHEQGAAFMANVHGRLTGDAGVCLSTLGPGATNLLTGVADAFLDRAPLVAITGQTDREALHRESHQTLDIVSMFDAVTKWNAQVGDPETVHESARKAFKVAEYEKPGPTHIELPEDVAGVETSVRPLPQRERVRRPNPDRESARELASMVASAERPLVIAGNGAVRTDASDALCSFVEATNAPVASTFMGKGALPDDDERSLFTLDSGTHGEAKQAISRADLVVTVGFDIAEHDPAAWNLEDTRLVHVDSIPAEVYEQYDPDLEVVADVGATLRAVNEEIRDGDSDGGTGAVTDDDWYADLREHIVSDALAPPDEESFSVRGALPTLRDVLADEDVLVSDVGSHKMAIARHYPAYAPNTCVISNGLASMGIAVPGALGADLAVDANVVAATGDGGFLMNAAELETASRLDCSFTVLVFRDDDYGLISEQQVENRGTHFGTGIGNPDFVAFAESFGVDAVRPESWEELEDALEDAVASDSLTLVEVPLGE